MTADLPAHCATSQPWSNNALKRLSNSLRDDTPAPSGGPSYAEVLIWYDDLTAAVDGHLRGLDWSRVADELGEVRITSRVKTIDTLRDKLRRTPTISLGYVQDVAGVRLEAPMSLQTQDAVVSRVAGLFGHDATAIKDCRSEAHSGYRAVHVWLRLPAGRVEVQIRTRLQAQWANAYEALADWIGRGIRYGDLPTEPMHRQLVEAMVDVSVTQLAELEELGAHLTIARRDLEQLRRARQGRIGHGDEAHTRVDALVIQIADLRDHYEARERTYHELLVELEEGFRALRRAR